MGGIFGAISNSRPVAPIIRMGLEKLMDRGLDGAGIVTLYNGKFFLKKDAGRIDEVNKRLNLDDMPGYIGLGHVRSATHGRPVYENTHPIMDCTGNIALVMDGVLSDYEELKKSLEPRHSFSSRTDAEVIAHFIEEKQGDGILNALSQVPTLRGYFAIAMLEKGSQSIYALSMGNPLIVAVDGGEMFITSEEQALPMGKWKLYYLGLNQLAVLGPSGIKILDASTLSPIELKPNRVTSSPDRVNKGEFSHFMIKEIYDTPEALARAVNVLQDEYLGYTWLLLGKSHNVMLVGSGTSYHAALIGKHYLRSLAGIRAEAVQAGEFLYDGLDMVEPGTLIIAISQSGESADIIKSIRMAKRRGAIILGITNRLGSTLMRESNVYLPIGAGPEMAIPATKSFTSSLATLLQLAAMDQNKLMAVREEIGRAREIIMDILSMDKLKDIAKEVSEYDDMYVISGGPIGLPLAMEMSLKLKEAAQVHAEALNFREFKHGPMTLISSKFPVLAIMPNGGVDNDMESVVSEIWHRGGFVVVISKYAKKIPNDRSITINYDFDGLVTPIIYAPIMQLMAYRIGTMRGIDIDSPRNLAKVVTT